MWGLSIGHWIVVALIVVLLFGRGRISALMADLGKGAKEAKKAFAELDHDDVRDTVRELRDLPRKMKEPLL